MQQALASFASENKYKRCNAKTAQYLAKWQTEIVWRGHRLKHALPETKTQPTSSLKHAKK